MLSKTLSIVFGAAPRRGTHLLSLALPMLMAWPIASMAAGVGPTVKEVIEFTRIIQPVQLDDDTLQTQISPDGEQAFIVTRKADVARDRNTFEILLLDVAAKRLAAGRGSAPIHLLAVLARQDNDDANPALRDVRWAGDRTLVFRARMNDEPFQAYRIDTLTRQVTQLTHSPYGVMTFDVSQDLQRVVYVEPVQNPAYLPGARSLVAGAKSFWSVHGRQDSFRTQLRRFQYVIADAGARGSARPVGESFAESSGGFPRASISPDGRWLLLPKYEPGLQRAWGARYPQVAEATAAYGPSVNLDPLGYFSRPSTYVPRRLMVYSLVDGQVRAVLDAPDDSLSATQRRTDRLWQDGGRSVIIAGTYLPPPKGAETASPAPDAASHIIEFWPETGTWKPIAKLAHRLQDVLPGASAADASARFVAIDGDRHRAFERGRDGDWREVAETPAEVPRTAATPAAWRLQVRQAMDLPPDIVATGPAGQVLRLTELNPQFAPAQWGSMREFGWKDAKGRQWDGGLMVPAGFNPRQRYPLVIQSYDFSAKRFYRDGPNTYDGSTSGFVGRAFLREGILVLALPWRASTDAPKDEHGSIVAYSDGVRGAIEALVAEGWVDRDRVGIMGWSATGVRVLNLVTFTDVPIRAATMMDGDANTLYSMTITYAVRDGTQATKEEANEGGPYGATRSNWIRNDPSLNTECIRAALRIESYGAEPKNNWDVYALMRRQYKPVELIKFPDGAHALGQPMDRIISLQGNLDWFRFWLKGEKRSELLIPGETAENLREQYQRWEQMSGLKTEMDAKPRCARGDWGM